eukprot:25438_1
MKVMEPRIWNKPLNDDDIIGSGAFGDVYKVSFKTLDNYKALKVVSLDDENEHKNIIREIAIMTSVCRESNALVSVEEIYFDKEMDNIMLLMDLGICDASRIRTQCMADGFYQIVEWILSDVANGLTFMHRNNIAHRDIKPQNVLLFEDQNNGARWKITDLGFAKQFKDNPLKTIVGTPLYVAPEIMHLSAYEPSVDMFSFGCMVLYFCGHSRFKEVHHDPEKKGKSKKNRNKWIENISQEMKDRNEIPKTVIQVIFNTVILKPELRWTAAKVSTMMRECDDDLKRYVVTMMKNGADKKSDDCDDTKSDDVLKTAEKEEAKTDVKESDELREAQKEMQSVSYIGMNNKSKKRTREQYEQDTESNEEIQEMPQKRRKIEDPLESVIENENSNAEV